MSLWIITYILIIEIKAIEERFAARLLRSCGPWVELLSVWMNFYLVTFNFL